jgi:DNA replication and repair protein RecF
MERKPEGIGWKISATLQSLGQVHEIETIYSGDGSRSVRIDGKVTTQTALGRIARIIWLVPVMDRLWVDGAEGRRRFLDRLSMSFEPSHAQYTLDYERAMRERNKMLKEGINDPAWYSAVESQMAESGRKIEQNRLYTIDRIMEAQTNVQTSFPTAQLGLVGANNEEIIVDDLKDAFANNRRADLFAGRTLIGPHRDDLTAMYSAKETAAKLCSTGEQKALLVSLILANGRALSQDFGSAPILLLDEVSAHLDIERQNALYEEIISLGAQAWMTGTGKELFEAFGDRAQFLEVNEASSGSFLK